MIGWPPFPAEAGQNLPHRHVPPCYCDVLSFDFHEPSEMKFQSSRRRAVARRPLTPPYVPFGIRRFSSLHRLFDSSQRNRCNLDFLVFDYSKNVLELGYWRFASSLFLSSPTSMPVPHPSLLVWGLYSVSLFSSIVSMSPYVSDFLTIRPMLLVSSLHPPGWSSSSSL